MIRRVNRVTAGFTLTELLVALALIIFIMAIMAQAFGAASKAVGDLRAANELAERLRAIANLLREDLSERLKPAHLRNGRLAVLSSLTDDWQPNPPDGGDVHEGFFRIYQVGHQVGNPAVPSPLPVTLGQDQTYVTTGTSLHFTRFMRGTHPDELFSVALPRGTSPILHPLMTFGSSRDQENRYQSTDPNPPVGSPIIYRSRVAEIAWWLAPTGDFTPEDPAGTLSTTAQPLFALCRRQRLLVEGNAAPQVPWRYTPVGGPNAENWYTDLKDPQFREVSFPKFDPPPQPPSPPPMVIQPQWFHPNTSASVTVPALRFGGTSLPHRWVPLTDESVVSPPPAYTFNNTLDPRLGPGPAPLPSGDAVGHYYSGRPPNAPRPPNLEQPFPFTAGSTQDAADIVMNDVLSMDVRVRLSSDLARDPLLPPVHRDRLPEFIDIGDPLFQWYNSGNPHYPLPTDPLPAGQTTRYYAFDTWTSRALGNLNYNLQDVVTGVPRWRTPRTYTCIPVFRHHNRTTNELEGHIIKIAAIQVTIRIWDSKSGFTRQVSLDLDM